MNHDNYYSIDRLVEFGMGLGVAQQMINSMNVAIKNTYIPGATHPMGLAPAHAYFLVLDGTQAGPFYEVQLTQLIVQRKVTKDTYVWRPGMAKWEYAKDVPDVLRLVALAPPCPPPIPVTE